jgi:hypothetical protein
MKRFANTRFSVASDGLLMMVETGNGGHLRSMTQYVMMVEKQTGKDAATLNTSDTNDEPACLRFHSVVNG